MWLRHLDLRGVAIRVACRTGRVLSLSDAPLVLVDLVHGSGLSREDCEALRRERERRGLPVFALHDHDFGDDPVLRDLSVDGFCLIADWSPIVETLTGIDSAYC